MTNPEFKDEYTKYTKGGFDFFDGWLEYSRGNDINTLWDLVLKVPENVSRVIIEHLPESAGSGSGIPKHVLDGMSDRQLETLFSRSDIGLRDLRKQKFLEALEWSDKDNGYQKEMMYCTAIMYAFDMTNEDFTDIMLKSDELRMSVLQRLSIFAEDLRVCLYEAIRDALSAANKDDCANFAEMKFERKLRHLEGRQRDNELRELKLYRLAVEAVGGYPPSDDLAFLDEAVVEGDNWATFVAFSKKWDEARLQTEILEKHLPKIWEAGEENDDVLDATAQEKTLEAVSSVKVELTDLRRLHKNDRVFFLIVVGILSVLSLVNVVGILSVLSLVKW